jgi:hypothetical protein
VSKRRLGIALVSLALGVAPVVGCGTGSTGSASGPSDSDSWYETGKETLDYQNDVYQDMYGSDYNSGY